MRVELKGMDEAIRQAAQSWIGGITKSLEEVVRVNVLTGYNTLGWEPIGIKRQRQLGIKSHPGLYSESVTVGSEEQGESYGHMIDTLKSEVGELEGKVQIGKVARIHEHGATFEVPEKGGSDMRMIEIPPRPFMEPAVLDILYQEKYGSSTLVQLLKSYLSKTDMEVVITL